MPSYKPIPHAMILDIDSFLATNRSRCIPVYREAETIRVRWEKQNIALEDVVSVLVERCGVHDVAMSFDRGDIEVLVENPDEDVRSSRCG